MAEGDEDQILFSADRAVGMMLMAHRRGPWSQGGLPCGDVLSTKLAVIRPEQSFPASSLVDMRAVLYVVSLDGNIVIGKKPPWQGL